MAIRSVTSRLQGKALILALSLLLPAFTAVIVVGHSSGRLPLMQAALLLLAPVVAVGIALRPAWVVVFILAVPSGLLGFVPTRGFVLLALLTLGGQLVTHGKLHVDWRSGMLPMLLLVALAYFYKADAGDQALIARGYFNLLTFWALLGLIAYNAVRLGELDGRTIVTALLFGLTVEALLGTGGIAESSVLSAGGEGPGDVRTGYVGAMGFSVSFGSLLLFGRHSDAGKNFLLALLAAFFLVTTIQAFVRAGWVSALLFVIFVARWTGKRRYWLVLPLVLIVVAIVPVARERVAPGVSETGLRDVRVAEITTGRTELWDILWDEEVWPALPFGNGYGHTFNLTPEHIFGFQTFQLDPDVNPFVFPHNDFIYWMIEFGLIGLAALLIFWFHLLALFKRVTRGVDEVARRSCYILAGILIMMFVVQVIDNAFAIRTVSDRFFIVAGFVFGLAATTNYSIDRYTRTTSFG